MSRKPFKQIDLAELRHRIKFQNLVKTSDGQGGFTEEWTDVVTVWAKVEPANTSERLFAQQIEMQRSHKVVIRYRSDITQTMRFIFSNRTFQIKSVMAPDERKRYLFIDAKENEGT